MKDLQPLEFNKLRLSGTLAVGILTTFYCMGKKPVKAKGNFYVKHDCHLQTACLPVCSSVIQFKSIY